MPAACVFAWSARKFGCKTPLVCMVNGVPSDGLAALAKMFDLVKEVDLIECVEKPIFGSDNSYSGRWDAMKKTPTKLRAFGLVEFAMVMIVDADIVCTSNPDDFFDNFTQPSGCVLQPGKLSYIVGGCVIVRTDIATLERVRKRCASMTSTDLSGSGGPDEILFTEVLTKDPSFLAMQRLPFRTWTGRAWDGWIVQDPRSPFFTFLGAHKPWSCKDGYPDIVAWRICWELCCGQNPSFKKLLSMPRLSRIKSKDSLLLWKQFEGLGIRPPSWSRESSSKDDVESERPRKKARNS